ncbi:MAG: hypothetical protein HYT16_03540 [DPANN group archaeon]|nr:hypothetical protein [DPANN group archaeon]
MRVGMADEQLREQPKDFIKPLELQKKPSIWPKIIVICIVFFMVAWVVAGFSTDIFSGKAKLPKNAFQIGGYTFYTLEDGTFGTYTAIGQQKIPIAFRLDPRKAGDIPFFESVLGTILNSEKVYITFDPDNPKERGKLAVAAAEISRITSLYQIETTAAFTHDTNPIEPKIPIRSCGNAKAGVSIIELRFSDRIYIGVDQSDNRCIVVEAPTGDDLILAADKLGMNLVGIRV